jgi:hypothetical protein
MAMLKVESAPIVIPLLLVATPAVADVANELARCQLEAERLFPSGCVFFLSLVVPVVFS